MKTIGEILKEARNRKRYSLAKVEGETKIKKEFIEAIEKENWEVLPDFTVVVGFVKNIARYLGVSARKAVALLRRDYPPKTLSINPKPDVANKFTWSPRLTFIVGVGIILVVILGYLGFQYAKFVSPPRVEVYEPKDGQVVTTNSVTVAGKTDPDATLKANNEPILVGEDGKFQADIQIFAGTTEIVIKATSRSGKEMVIHRKIKPELK